MDVRYSRTKMLAKWARVGLAFALVAGLWPARAFAWDAGAQNVQDAHDAAAQDAQGTPDAQNVQGENALQAVSSNAVGIDLADTSQWSHMSAYSLAAGGSYYLSDDVTVTDSGGIIFIAAGEATLDLRGHTLSFGEDGLTSGASTTGMMIGSISGEPVKLNIISSTKGEPGAICFYNTDYSLTLYETAQVSVDNVNVKKKMTTNPSVRTYISGSGSAAVNITNKGVGTSNLKFQQFHASNCTISSDLSQFARPTTSGLVSAIYTGSHTLQSTSLKNVVVECAAPESITSSDGTYLDAYGIYCANADCLGTGTDFTIMDSTLKATSLNGSAYGFGDVGDALPTEHLGTTCTFAGTENVIDLSQASTGEGWAVMSLRTEQGAIKLGCEVDISTKVASTGDSLQSENGIWVGGEKGLTLLEGFKSDAQIGVMAGTDLFNANRDDVTFASNETGKPESALVGTFVNALYESGLNTCGISSRTGELFFATNESDALVQLVTAAGESHLYGSFAAGMSQLGADDTLKLLTNLPTLDVTAGEGVTGTIDLCGRTLGSLAYSSDKDLTITSSQDGAKMQHEVALTGKYTGIVANTGTGALELDNISLEVSSAATTKSFCAAYAGGSGLTTLKDCTVIAKSRTWTAGLVATTSAPVLLQNTDVSASSEGSNAIGLFTTSSLTLTINQCDIDAQATGTASKADAVRLSGNVTSDADAVRIMSSALNAKSEGQWSYGLYINGNQQNVTLAQADVSATLSGSVETAKCAGLYYKSATSTCSIMSCSFAADVTGSAANSADAGFSMAVEGLDAQVSVNGALSLSSSAGKHIKYSCPITVANAAPITTDGADGAIGTYAAAQTPNDALFLCASSMAESLKSRVSELAGGYYENLSQSPSGWQLKYDEDKHALVWNADPVASVSGKSYPTLQEALNAAKSGDTITLLSNVSSTRVLTISRGVTIDLCGHTVELRCDSADDAVVVDAAEGKDVQIIDSTGRSESTGSLTLLVGQDAEKEDLLDGRSSNAGQFYAGISMKGAADLTIKDCDVNVAYAGNAQGYAVGVQGVYQEQGAGALQLIGAHVRVSGSAETSLKDSAESGATRTFGIYSDAADGTISVDADSEVSATNSGTPLLRGVNVNRLLSGDVNTSYSAALVSSGTVREVTLDASSAIYQETCELFVYQAKYDADTRVYYACPLELSDGTLVWAFTDVVPVSEVGSKAAMVPTHFYMQSMYTITPDAKGIVLGDFAGQVSVTGTISVTSDEGESCAMDASQNKSQTTWNIDGAKLSASTNATQDVNACTGKEPDAGAQLGLDGSWWRNSLASVREVVQRTPMACLFEGCENAPARLVLSGETTFTTSGKHAAAFYVAASTVQIAEGWKPSASGNTRFAVEGTGRGNVPGSNFATGAVTNEMTTLFYDAADKVALVFDQDTLHWDGVCTVEFVDATGTLLQTNEGVGAGQSVLLPGRSLVQRGANETYSYEFLGWALDASADEPDVLASQEVMRFEPVAGAAKVTYYPIYRTNPVRISVSFAGMHGQSAVSFQVDAGAELQKSISSQEMTAAIPTLSSYTQDGVTYVPVGWSLTSDGETAVLTPSAVAEYKAYADVRCTASYMAVGADQSLVEFIVDGTVYAKAVNTGQRPSWSDASAENGQPTRTTYGMTCSFAGWENSTKTYGPTDELPKVQQAGKRFTYTAQFTETPSLYNIDFAGVYFKTESGEYARDDSKVKIYCPFGTDPEETLMTGHGTQRSFTQNGYVYKLVGWSTRADDVEPLYGPGELPKVMPDKTGSLGLVYYAYYEVAPATTTVVFQVGDTVYATADNLKISSTIAQAFAATGKENPQVEGYEFLGWVASQDATKALTSITPVSRYVDADTGRATLWALFKQSATPDPEPTPDPDPQPTPDPTSSSDDPQEGGESSGGEPSSSGTTPTTNTTTVTTASVPSSAPTSTPSVSAASATESQTSTQTGTTNVSAAPTTSTTSDSTQTSQVDETAGQGNVLATLFAVVAVLLVALFIWWRIRRKNSQFETAEAEAPQTPDEDWDQITFDEEDFS